MLSKITPDLISAEITKTGMAKHEALLESSKSLQNKGNNDPQAVEDAANKFEALLLHQMIRSMWSTVEQKGVLGEDSNAQQIFRDMLNEAVAKTVSEGEGIGIKKYLRRELLGVDEPSKPRKA